MADTKISLLTQITSPQDPTKMYVPLFAQDGTPLNARMNFSEIFKTPVQMNLNATVANSAVIFSTPADGRLLLTDYAGTSFGRLQLGGITNAYPSLKRNATGIDFRLADDSGYAPITAAAIVSSSTIAATGAVSGTKFAASNTVTADSPAFDAAQTWNNVGVTFTGMKLNITDTASNAASKLLDLQVAGSSKAYFTKTELHLTGAPTDGSSAIFLAGTNFGIGYYSAVPGMLIGNPNAATLYITLTDYRLTSDKSLGWASSGWSGSPDISLSRLAAGVLGVSGVVSATNVRRGQFTITDGASVNLNPASGAFQTWTIAANRTPIAPTNFNNGDSFTLHLARSGAYDVTWTTVPVTWVDGLVPTIPASGYAIIQLWKTNNTIYGVKTGDVA